MNKLKEPVGIALFEGIKGEREPATEKNHDGSYQAASGDCQCLCDGECNCGSNCECVS